MTNNKVVPPADIEIDSARYISIEERSLEASAREKENRNKEAEQRIFLRTAAVILAVVVMLAMVAMFLYVTHLFVAKGIPEDSPVYVIVALIAPVVSVTAISIAFLLGVFRGYKDVDGDKAIQAVADVARSSVVPD